MGREWGRGWGGGDEAAQLENSINGKKWLEKKTPDVIQIKRKKIKKLF